MAQEYTVAHVESGVREWQHPSGGTIYYHRAYITGRDKPVEVGKKSAGAVKAGDVLYGDITPTEYPTDKFKALPRDGGGWSGGGRPQRSPESREKEQEGMAWGNALTNATSLVVGRGIPVDATLETISRNVYELTTRLYESRKKYEHQPQPDQQPTDREVEAGPNFEDIPF